MEFLSFLFLPKSSHLLFSAVLSSLFPLVLISWSGEVGKDREMRGRLGERDAESPATPKIKRLHCPSRAVQPFLPKGYTK
ncbi:hypothetical protein A3844_10630 [Paenibacillus helianthi]|uniref:Secreted protein n=1 Tax=Paenibacillus helianthi TaxID=1349432 RepID=A0ABX3EPD2_9BACL|nr:hypothetical protein A3844_10630 [Paenibacillus helianthi]